MPTYEQGYVPPLNANPSEPVSYSRPPKQDFSYGPFSQPQAAYQPGPINVTVVNNFTTSPNNNKGALLAEIILSLFGIYGVGWLLAGETTTGVVLLICSFALFWPLAIAIAIFTLGFGIIFCNLPLAIGGLIFNQNLINYAVYRLTKLTSYTKKPT